MLKKGYWLPSCALFLQTLLVPVSIPAEDIVRLQAGVVKITAKPPQGTANVGTGFIVRVDKDAAYIVTAAHVVAGDRYPKVEFFTKRNLPVTAEVLGLEGDDEVRGLALLVVKGSENLPKGLTSLSLAGAARLTGGEDIMAIGFPRNAGPWAIVKGNISSRQGRDIFFSPSVESGHSGGPIFQDGKVIGVVGSGIQSVGRGVTVRSVQDYIEGFGITTQEDPNASTPINESSPSPAEIARTRAVKIIQTQIAGKDGAPMVLIPAGEFWMGSTAEELKEVVEKCNVSRHFDKQADCKEVFLDEMPRHRVSVGSFLLDKHEVTNERFEKFSRQTGYRTTAERKGNALTFVLGIGWKEIEGASWLKPEGRESVFETRRNQHPVVAVSWEDARAYCRWAGKRLPREAEWEYAARAGTVTQYWWGDRASGPYDVANLLDDDEEPVRATRGLKIIQWRDNYRQTSPVGAFRPNPWGLYDMIGNVWEWVDDWYDASSYSTEKPRIPDGLLGDKERVLRGGSWDNEPFVARVTTRGRESEDTRSPAIGFRCAQDAVNPAVSEELASKDGLNTTETLRAAPAYQCSAKPIAPLKRKPEVFVSQWRAAIESMKAERNVYDLQNLFEIWGRIPVGLTGEQLVAEARYTVDCLAASGHLETEFSTKPGQYWRVQFDNISMKFKK